jgi:hypothetical protein
MLRLNRYSYVYGLALLAVGCASQPPVLYPGKTPAEACNDCGLSIYTSEGSGFYSPALVGGNPYYPYFPVIAINQPAATPVSSPSLPAPKPVLLPPAVNHGRVAIREPCSTGRGSQQTKACR